MSTVSTLASKWRARRRNNKNYREFKHAVDSAGSPALRDELLSLASQQNHLYR